MSNLACITGREQTQLQIKHYFFNDILPNMCRGEIITKHQLKKKLNITINEVEWFMVYLQKEQPKYSSIYIIYYIPIKINIIKVIKRL